MVYFNSQEATYGLIGGVLIAFSLTVNLLFLGRLSGFSGVLHSLPKWDSTTYWKSCIFSGLLLSSGVAYHLFGFKKTVNHPHLFDSPETFVAGLNVYTLLAGGFLVGIGTKLANGCTSGHGLAGLPRFSKRSFVAVITFMAFGVIMANARRFLPKWKEETVNKDQTDFYINCAIAVSVLIMIYNILLNNQRGKRVGDMVISWIVGVIAGIGLIVSSMAKKSKVLGFLTIDDDWDPTLMFVMGGGVMLNLITFNLILNLLRKPLIADEFKVPESNKITGRLVVGSALFGIGWGLCGLCPGPAIIVAPYYAHSMMKFFLGLIVGSYVGYLFEGEAAARGIDSKAARKGKAWDSSKFIKYR